MINKNKNGKKADKECNPQFTVDQGKIKGIENIVHQPNQIADLFPNTF